MDKDSTGHIDSNSDLRGDAPEIRRVADAAAIKAEENGEHYEGGSLNRFGKKSFVALLRLALRGHDDRWLTRQFEGLGCMASDAPKSMARQIAEQHFLRFFMIGICVKAIAANQKSVRVYRARPRSSPRDESKRLEGTPYDAKKLLRELESLESFHHACALSKPNSGLAVEPTDETSRRKRRKA
jgi:hypothetical protein